MNVVHIIFCGYDRLRLSKSALAIVPKVSPDDHSRCHILVTVTCAFDSDCAGHYYCHEEGTCRQFGVIGAECGGSPHMPCDRVIPSSTLQ